jgi:exosome complex RNA-binding protein Csl4
MGEKVEKTVYRVFLQTRREVEEFQTYITEASSMDEAVEKVKGWIKVIDFVKAYIVPDIGTWIDVQGGEKYE